MMCSIVPSKPGCRKLWLLEPAKKLVMNVQISLKSIRDFCILLQVCYRNFQSRPRYQFNNLKFLGVHPHDAKDWNDGTLEALKKLQENPSCVAVGECGLDFNRNFSPQDVQKEVFAKQVDMAVKLQKPLFIHEREAHEDMVKILTAAGPS